MVEDSKVRDIMQALGKVERINEVSFIQCTNDAYLKDETKGFLKVIRDELKSNLSIMSMQLFSNEDM